MKKILVWTGIVVGVLVLLIVAASVVLMLVVNKDMVAGQMEALLHRQVRIRDVNVSIFSTLSGVQVEGVRISNRKSKEQIADLQGKPVADNDLFVDLGALNLKLRILPLLSRKLELSSLTLVRPEINIVKYRNGRFNFSDLLEPPESQSQDPSAPASAKKKPARPFDADDMPVSLSLGKIGVEKGTVNYRDQSLGVTFQVYGLTFLAYDAEIDARDLAKKDTVKLDFQMGVKPLSRITTGAVQYFDIELAAKGFLKPFDVKTRLLDPELDLKVGSPRGTLTGLQIFEVIASVKQLAPYTGDLAFLKDEVNWTDASLDLWYKSDIAKVSGGKFSIDGTVVNLAGTTNIKTKAVDLHVKIDLSEKEQKNIEEAIQKNVTKEIRGDVAKYLPPAELTEMVMKQFVDETGKIYFAYDVHGTTRAPSVTLVHPKVPPLPVFVRQLAGDVAGVAAGQVEKEAGQAIQKGIDGLLKGKF